MGNWKTGEWLISFESKLAVQNRNVLLIQDQCSAHANKEQNLKNVCLLYLPLNTTSYMQPLDRGTIFCMNCMYWNCLVTKIARNVPAADIRKRNILDAMCTVACHVTGIHYACSSWKLLCKMCFGNVSESAEDEENKLVEFLGQINCPINLKSFSMLTNWSQWREDKFGWS